LREQDTGGARGSAKANLESYRDDHISRQPRLTLAIAYGKLSSIVFLFVTNHPAFLRFVFVGLDGEVEHVRDQEDAGGKHEDGIAVRIARIGRFVIIWHFLRKYAEGRGTRAALDRRGCGGSDE
jgi:hypothetical protein